MYSRKRMSLVTTKQSFRCTLFYYFILPPINIWWLPETMPRLPKLLLSVTKYLVNIVGKSFATSYQPFQFYQPTTASDNRNLFLWWRFHSDCLSVNLRLTQAPSGGISEWVELLNSLTSAFVDREWWSERRLFPSVVVQSAQSSCGHTLIVFKELMIVL